MIVKVSSCLAIASLATLFISPEVQAGGELDSAAAASVRVSATQGLNSHPMNGPDSADSLLTDNREEKADLLDRNVLKDWEAWKADLKETTGFSFGADYTAVGFMATESLGDESAASGIGRLFGSWAVLNRNTQNTGSLEFKGEYRHSYTDVAPAEFGLVAGYAGVPEPVFSDQGLRATTLYWKQHLLNDRAIARLGLIDIKEYFDVYAMASPWTGFGNLAFSTGANTMIALPDGAFGAMLGGYLTDNIYAATGIADASADPTTPLQTFDTFFSDFDTFKTFEIGLTGGGKQLFLENAHISFWHLDDSAETGAPGGWGVLGSASTLVDDTWLAFLRGGWAHEGGGLYEASVSAGLGHMNKPGGNLLGVGLNWGQPNSDTFSVNLNDQWTGEVFYRVQLLENLQLTPSVQLLVNPALNPNEDLIALFGLRGRLTF